MSPADAVLAAGAVGMVAGFCIHFLIDRRLCEKCGAMAMPNQTRALIHEARRADKMEDTLLQIANSSATNTATMRALAWQAIRENER